MRRYYPRGFEPDLHRDRLAAPQHTRVPAEAVTTPAADLVFTVSMGDLLGVGVPDEWVEEVLAAIRAAPWWRFCVLTKQPARLAGFQWPSNAWLGSTLTGDVTTPDPIARAEALGAVEVPVRFVSFEPLLGPVPEAVLDAGRVSWVIVGGRSPANGLPRAYPPADVLADLLRACDRRGLPVFEKTNLRPTGAARRTEWPRGCEAV
jgi:protein gp37